MKSCLVLTQVFAGSVSKLDTVLKSETAAKTVHDLAHACGMAPPTRLTAIVRPITGLGPFPTVGFNGFTEYCDRRKMPHFEGWSNFAAAMGLILCIDDDSNDVLLLQRSLIKGGIDCRVYHAWSLQEAEDYLAGEHQFDDRLRFPLPDVILTDLAFRGGTGIDFLKWFASRPDLARIPVLCVTGSDDPRKREEARKFGAPCVSKSSNFIDVVNKIREMLICSPGYSSH